MIPALLLKCQGYPTKGPLQNEHFFAIPSICNQRTLVRFQFLSFASTNGYAFIQSKVFVLVTDQETSFKNMIDDLIIEKHLIQFTGKVVEILNI